MARPPKGTPSKSDFIRKLPFEMSAADVVAKAGEAGFVITAALVHKVRGRSRASQKPTDKAAPKAAAKAAPKAAAKAAPKAAAKAAPKAAAKAPAGKRVAKAAAAPAVASFANASDFIRAQPLTRAVSEIVNEGKAMGLKVSAGLVYNIRGQLKRSGAAPAAAKAPKAAAPKAPKAAAKAPKVVPAAKGKAALTPPARKPSSSELVQFRKLVLELGVARAKQLVSQVEATLKSLLSR